MSSTNRSFVSGLKQPSFLIAAGLLAVFALTLNTAVATLQLTFKKKPCALRVESLKAGIPQKLGAWVCVSPDSAIDPETEQVLATSQYVFRDYVDSRTVSTEMIEQMKNASPGQRNVMLAQIQTTKPASVIRAAVTYYTGSADTVAHVPERCYVADGFEVKEYSTEHAALGNYPDGTARDVDFRFLGFEDRAATGREVQRVSRNVGYVFHCDGQYESNPYVVRQHLQNLFERYGYYAKIEMMTAASIAANYKDGPNEVNDKAESIAAMKDFLAEALPEVEKCLPDWKKLHEEK